MTAARSGATRAGVAALTVGALGVVFGDIGTSPLYALQTVFAAHDHAVKPDEAGVYGIISLVFWAITIVVSVKYVTFIMRADNQGEGGIMALIARILDLNLRGRAAKSTLIGLGIFGAALFYGDGMITPAISVLSAVEGLKVAAPSLESLVLPITLVDAERAVRDPALRHARRRPAVRAVMALWFTILAVAGLAEVIANPAILKALSPTYGVEFFLDNGGVAFLALAGWCSPSPAPRRSTPTWATSAARRSARAWFCVRVSRRSR